MYKIHIEHLFILAIIQHFFSFWNISVTFAQISCIFMKKLLIFTCMLILAIQIQAQNISVNTKYVNYTNYNNKNIDVLFINQINNLTELKVTPYAGVNIKWYKYDMFGIGNEISNQNFISPENNTGYVLEYNGVKKYIWVFDYQLVKPVVESLSMDMSTENTCSKMVMNLRSTGFELPIYSINGIRYNFPFQFNIQYKSLKWVVDSKSFLETDEQVDDFAVLSSDHKVEISNPPLKDTYFILKGDQVATDLGLETLAFTSELYSAVKTEGHMFTETTVRTAKNEADRPENVTMLTGSAPLEITFTGFANEPVATKLNWQILRDAEIILNMNGENQHYTFKEAGSYMVKFIASSATCSYTDSVIVKVSESAIFAPNVFTPNGDGVNDEFRVAYKSILKFKGIIFNRWGKRVFSWTDPTKGWDGNIGGRPAATGAYFYIIEAEGSDKKNYKLKGDINLLRGNSK